jgi:hypothetical protein
MFIFSVGILLNHLFIAIAAFSVDPGSTVAASSKPAAYVVAVFAVVSASLRAVQLFVYLIGDGTWNINYRMGNASASVVASAVLVGMTAPKTGVLYENRSFDTTPTSQAILYGSVVSLIFTFVETVTSHFVFVALEPPRDAAYGPLFRLQVLLITCIAGLSLSSLGMNAYALWACNALKEQTAVPYAQHTAVAVGAIDAAGVLQAFLAASLAFHVLAIVNAATRGISKNVDTQTGWRMLRIVVSLLSFMFACVSFGAVFPRASTVAALRGVPGTAFASGTNYALPLQNAVFSCFALFAAEIVMHHAMAASRRPHALK